MVLIVIIACNHNIHHTEVVNDQELSFEDKVRMGKNTGTPIDMFNRNPYSVFDTYSPYNIYQNP